jgi:hypothetical protein
VAAKISVNQIVDLHSKLRYLGVPIKGQSFLLGYNQAVVDSSAITHSSKQHKAHSCHWVCNAIAIKVVNKIWVNGKDNLADIASKHWAYPQIWRMLQPFLFYPGDAKAISKENNISKSCNN